MQAQLHKSITRSLRPVPMFIRQTVLEVGGLLRIYPVWHRFVVWLALILALGAIFNSRVAAAGADTNLFRLGFSAKTFSNVNENDAMAAIKIMTTSMAEEIKVPFDSSPSMLDGTKVIRQAIVDKSVDAVALPIDEFWRLRDVMDTQTIIVPVNEGQLTEEYVLLVHQDSGIKRLEDLRGRKLAFFQNFKMCLASIWLDTVLVQSSLSRTSEFARITQATELAEALLPVFFRQIDACVVTRRGFNTMNELNPQISRRLKVLASSPELVTGVFGFRRGYNGLLRESMVEKMSRAIESPAGMQVQTLFQFGRLQVHPLSCLASSFDLLATHKRLFGESYAGIASKVRVIAAGEPK